jgi:hypothetical protein
VIVRTREEEITRLEISVHDVAGMGIMQSGKELREKSHADRGMESTALVK